MLPAIIFAAGLGLTYLIAPPLNVIAFPMAVAAAAYSGRLKPYIAKSPASIILFASEYAVLTFAVGNVLAVALPDDYKVAAYAMALGPLAFKPFRNIALPHAHKLSIASILLVAYSVSMS